MPSMATLPEKMQCERDTRAMLERNGIPPPDRVEYGFTCIRLFWEDSKVVLVVDIDDPPEGLEPLQEDRDDVHLSDLDLDDDLDNEWTEDDDYNEAAEALGRMNGGGPAEEEDMY